MRDHRFIEGSNVDFEKKIQEEDLSNTEEGFYKDRKKYYGYRKNLYSLNSIIYAANRLFDKDESKIPSDYDLVLIDEFQDFNKCECEFIHRLNRKTKVVLVGDEKPISIFV